MGHNPGGKSLRLSPNEIQELVRQEREKWKIFRIQQVREQAREEAKRIREAVHRQESIMTQELQQAMEQQWQAEKENKVLHLHQEYQDSMKNIGQAHKLAKEQPNAIKILLQQDQHNRRLAERRGCEANKLQREEAWQEKHKRNKLLKHRQDVLHLEKLRANHVANLATPEVFKKKKFTKKKEPPKVELHEAGTFTTTYYQPKHVTVEKEVWSSKPNARETAAAEEAARAERERVRQKKLLEEECKREQRGREALNREHLIRLRQQLIGQLDEAQYRHQISYFLQGRDISDSASEQNCLKGKAHQQRQMEVAVEKLLQEEEEKEEQPVHDTITDAAQIPSQESTDYLEDAESSGSGVQETHFGTKVRDLKSLLKEIEKRRNCLIRELHDSSPPKETSLDRDSCETDTWKRKDDGPSDKGKDIHFAETVPVHLHPGYTTRRSQVNGPITDAGPSRQAVEPETDTSKGTDSSSTVLPLSEESLPLTTDSTQPTTPSPSLPPRFSTLLQDSQWLKPTHTHTGQSNLTKPRATTFEGSSIRESGSGDIKVNIDIDGGSSSLESVTIDAQPQSGISSTEYNSPPSVLPRREISLQEIEENLKKIHQQRHVNQNLIDSLSKTSKKRSSDDTLNTYIEKLKEEGSGKKPLKKKEKYELQKKEVIQFYIRRLLQMGDDLGDLSASTVEGSGLTISLGSLLNIVEEGKGDLPITSPLLTTPSTSRSTSAYEDTDKVPVRLRSMDSVKNQGQLPHHISTSTSPTTPSIVAHSTTSTYKHAPIIGPHHTTSTTVPHHIVTDPYCTPAVIPTMDPNLTITSIPTTHPHHPSDPHHSTHLPLSLHSHHTSITNTDSHHSSEPQSFEGSVGHYFRRLQDLRQEMNSDLAVSSSTSATPTTSSTARSPQVNSESSLPSSPTLTYHTPSREDESSMEEVTEVGSDPGADHPSVRPGKRNIAHMEFRFDIRHQRYRLWQQHKGDTTHTDTTGSGDECLEIIKKKSPKFSGKKPNNIGSIEINESSFTQPVPATATTITTSDSTQMTDQGEASRGAEASSEESVISMPDMAEVLRRFGLDVAKSSSSSASSSSEGKGRAS